MLADPPLARTAQAAKKSAAAGIGAKQATFRAAAVERGVKIIGSTNTLLNAVFLSGTEEEIAPLRDLAGVVDIVKDRPAKRHLNRALDLINAPAAWNVLGGRENAGRGTKIGVLDTGIDHNHPAFRNSPLGTPAGFPKCRAQECAFTNGKVIVARSYVDTLATGNGTPEDSRPDDLTPRDRVGHGTAVAMIAAGHPVTGPAASITGVAPMAWVGNYKVFGAPGVNDSTFASVIVLALEDALLDGMDVATMSLGLPALWSYRDAGSICQKSGNTPCDLFTAAVENAARAGLTIVASAGNDGDLGFYPNLNSINSPAAAPSVISVGATTNAHLFNATARVVAGDAPPELNPMYTLFSDGPPVTSTLQAPVRDVAALGDDGTACQPLGNGTLSGAIALIKRGGACGIATKVNFAQKAGAVAVLIYRDSGNFVFRMSNVEDTGIPSALIGNTAGVVLKEYLRTHPDAQVSINPALTEIDDTAAADEITYFSSQGPAIGDLLIKPELVAPGTGLYVATQMYDPNGDMYDPSGFTVQQGTSFAVPLVAGAVAIAKQRFPRLTPAQAKSMVVNTANPSNIIDYDANNQVIDARVTAMGAGKLDVGAVARTTITAEPAVLSFGEVGTGRLPSTGVRFSNVGSTPVTLTFRVARREPDSRANISISPSSLTLGANQSAQVTVQLTGSNPTTGSYEGAIIVSGGPVELRIPYLYLVGDNVADNIFQVSGFDFVAGVGDRLELDFKVVDKYGVPVRNLAYRWTGISSDSVAGRATDDLGIGYAVVNIGSQVGEQSFKVNAGNLELFFDGRVLLPPTIRAGGVLNAASGLPGAAPGSYVTIYGIALAPSTRGSNTPYLPISLAGTSVSFDAPQAKLSLPGRISFVSESQINVQVPWELQGLNSVQMKVSIGLLQSALYTLQLSEVAPAFFEFLDNGRLSVAALDENFRLVSTGNPVRRGRVLQLFVNGLGAVTNTPASGEIALAQPLSTTRQQPSVTIGGRPATVQFSGLAPNLVGLYQVNVVVPEDAGTGVQQVTISMNGVASKSSNVAVN